MVSNELGGWWAGGQQAGADEVGLEFEPLVTLPGGVSGPVRELRLRAHLVLRETASRRRRVGRCCPTTSETRAACVRSSGSGIFDAPAGERRSRLPRMLCATASTPRRGQNSASNGSRVDCPHPPSPGPAVGGAR